MAIFLLDGLCLSWAQTENTHKGGLFAEQWLLCTGYLGEARTLSGKSGEESSERSSALQPQAMSTGEQTRGPCSLHTRQEFKSQLFPFGDVIIGINIYYQRAREFLTSLSFIFFISKMGKSYRCHGTFENINEIICWKYLVYSRSQLKISPFCNQNC